MGKIAVTSVHVYADKDGVTADYYNGDLLVLHTRRGSFRMDFGQETEIEQADDGRSMKQIPRKCESCRWWRESIGGACVVGEEAARLTAPDYGCVMWEAMK